MAVKNSQRFAEIERLMGDYFGCHLAPVMGRVQRDLSNRQADEMRAYSNSTAGILRSLATANMPGDDPYATLKITGKWNSKTTEDYLAMCKEAIVGNKDMQRDLAVMAEEWRKAVVTEIGRERYDALSKQLGCDLAYAYIDHRMEQLMIEKMVKDRMPTSSADYIIRKAAQSSLFGLPYELNKSPLAAEIEAKGEAAYKPSRTEKAAGLRFRRLGTLFLRQEELLLSSAEGLFRLLRPPLQRLHLMPGLAGLLHLQGFPGHLRLSLLKLLKEALFLLKLPI